VLGLTHLTTATNRPCVW